MRNTITTKDLIKQRFSEEKAQEILSQAEEEIKNTWGGKRTGAGRKPKADVLKFNRRLTERENKLIDDIRNNIISLDAIDKLKQG